MSNITPARQAHKFTAPRRATPVSPVIPLLLLLIAAGGGCGRRSASDRPTPAGGGGETRVPAADCAVRIDPTAYAAFTDLARRLTRAETVPDAAYSRVWALPAYASLFDATDSRLVNASILTNVTRYVYSDRPGGPPARVAPDRRGSRAIAVPKRKDLLDALTWARDHRAALDSVVNVVSTTPLICGVLPTVAPYVHPDRLPDTLRVTILVAGPDVRWVNGCLLVDAGVIAAAGPARLPRLLAAQLYRALAPLDGPAPAAAGGGVAALRATFAQLRREGVSAWIEGFPELEFDDSHPLLGRPEAERRDWHRLAVSSLATLQKMVPGLFDRPETIDTQGAVLDDLFRGAGTYRATGYAMAAVIATRLGEPRLQAVARGTPADFIAAYQEAVKRPAGPPLAERPWLDAADLTDLPPFPAPAYRSLMAVLEAASGATR